MIAENPLAMALRTIQSFYLKQDPGHRGGEPYPLIIVRPSGTQVYGIVRQALKQGWDTQFGYELISESMELAYPQPNRYLGNLITESIAEGKRRQRRLASAAPNTYVYTRPPSFTNPRKSHSGRNDLISRPHTTNHVPQQHPSSFRARSQGKNTQRLTNSHLSRTDLSTGRGSAPFQPQRHAVNNPQRAASERAGDFQPTGNRLTENQLAAQNQVAQSPHARSQRNTRQTNRQQSFPPSPSQSLHSHQGAGNQSVSSVAQSRGRGWAISGGRNRYSPHKVTRAIPIRLEPSRLIVDFSHRRQLTQFSLREGLTAPIANQLADLVTREIKQWGEPPSNSYWKPILEVQLAPQASQEQLTKQRLSQLRQLFYQSGVELQVTSK